MAQVSQNVEQDAAAIRELVERWSVAVAERDAAGLARMVDEEAMFLAPGRPAIRGRAAVEALFRQSFAACALVQDFAVEELHVAGDWAFVIGRDAVAITPLAGGATVHARGMGLSVLRRQPDGSWRFWRGINNMTVEQDSPSPAGAAAAEIPST